MQAEGAATGTGVSATQAEGVHGLGRGLERHRYAQEHPEHEGRRCAACAAAYECYMSYCFQHILIGSSSVHRYGKILCSDAYPRICTAVYLTGSFAMRRLQGEAFGAAAGVLGAAAAMRRQQMDRDGAQVKLSVRITLMSWRKSVSCAIVACEFALL